MLHRTTIGMPGRVACALVALCIWAVGCSAPPGAASDANSDSVPSPDAPPAAIDAGIADARADGLDASLHDAAAPCSDLCTAFEGASRCIGSVIQTCTTSANGCVEWVNGEDCAITKDACSESDAEATCVFDCSMQPSFPLSVAVTGSGSGVVRSSPAGIECGSDCTYDFAQNCTVVLNLIPDSNSTFAGWSGACTGTGPCILTPSSATALTVSAEFESTSTQLWSAAFGDIFSDYGQRIAVDSAGNVIVAGSYQETINPGGVPITSTSNSTDLFVAKFSPTGLHLWSRGIGGAGGEELSDMTVDSNDDVVLTGQFRDSVDFGGGDISAAGSERDFYIAKYSGNDGTHLWSRGFGGVLDDFAYGVATDSANNVFVTGAFRSIMNFGDAFVFPANFDVFVAKYDGDDGSYVWATQYGGPNADRGRAITIDATDNVLITGRAAVDVDFGGGPLASADVSLFLVKLDGQTAAHIWSVEFAPSATTEAQDMELDANGDAYIIGSFSNTADFLGTVLSSQGSKDMFVARFSGINGAIVWAKSYGGAVIDSPSGLAINGVGDVALTGTFSETVDFGVGTLTSVGGADIMVLKLTSMGIELAANRYGGVESEEAGDIALADDGSWILTAAFRGVFDVGEATLASAGILDVVVAAFAP